MFNGIICKSVSTVIKYNKINEDERRVQHVKILHFETAVLKLPVTVHMQQIPPDGWIGHCHAQECSLTFFLRKY